MKEHHAQGLEVKKSPGIVSLSQKSLLHVDLLIVKHLVMKTLQLLRIVKDMMGLRLELCR